MSGGVAFVFVCAGWRQWSRRGPGQCVKLCGCGDVRGWSGDFSFWQYPRWQWCRGWFDIDVTETSLFANTVHDGRHHRDRTTVETIHYETHFVLWRPVGGSESLRDGKYSQVSRPANSVVVTRQKAWWRSSSSSSHARCLRASLTAPMTVFSGSLMDVLLNQTTCARTKSGSHSGASRGHAQLQVSLSFFVDPCCVGIASIMSRDRDGCVFIIMGVAGQLLHYLQKFLYLYKSRSKRYY